VLVLGAGLAGLHAARLLERAGWQVTVLEAQDRVGGRVHSSKVGDVEVEWGGQVLSAAYQRAVGICKDLAVPTVTATATHGPRGACITCHKGPPEVVAKAGSGSTLWISGRIMREGEWPSLSIGVGEAERAIVPSRLLSTYLAKSNPLEDNTAWTKPAHAALDQMSVADYVAGLGASPEALRLMDVSPNCRSIKTASALWALRDDQRRRTLSGLPLLIEGGNQRLLDAMATSLRGAVHKRAVVAEVSCGANEVVVRCTDGSTHRADFGLSTIPLPAWSRVKITPGPSALEAEATSSLKYVAITLVMLKVLKPFWLDDGHSASMWTDSPIERVFPMRNATGDVTALQCFVDGEGAERLDAMDEARRRAFVVSELVRMRPAAKGAVEAVASMSWGRDPWSGGAYARYAPGQITRLRAVTSQPDGRLHFAGEHTAVTSPGMEGALESAERAVAELTTHFDSPQRPR
jgi:monoamine oxidase